MTSPLPPDLTADEYAVNAMMAAAGQTWLREPASDLPDGTQAYRTVARCTAGCRHRDHTERGLSTERRHIIWIRPEYMPGILHRFAPQTGEHRGT